MSQPHVAVVVLNWNGREDTLACLASLANVSDVSHSTVVVDNDSHDGSVDAIRSEYPDLPILVNSANLGFAGGNNVGLQWGLDQGATHVLLLNNDTEVEPDFLSAMVQAMTDQRLGICGAAIAYADQPAHLWAFGGGRFNVATGWVRHLQRPVGASELAPGGNVHFYVTGCAMLIDAAVVREVGLLDLSYFHFCEDVDFCLRASHAGFGVGVAPQARLIHKVSASTRVDSPVFLYYNMRSRMRLVQRHGPAGSPGRTAVGLLWLRLWRKALTAGWPRAGWRALARGYRDFREGVEGPAPADL